MHSRFSPKERRCLSAVYVLESAITYIFFYMSTIRHLWPTTCIPLELKTFSFFLPIKGIIRISVCTDTEIVFHEGEGIVPRRVRETRRFSTIQNNGKRLSDVSQRHFGALLHPRDSKTERKGRAAKHEKRLSWPSPCWIDLAVKFSEKTIFLS